LLDLLFFHLIKAAFLVFQLPAISDNGANRKFPWNLDEGVSRRKIRSLKGNNFSLHWFATLFLLLYSLILAKLQLLLKLQIFELTISK